MFLGFGQTGSAQQSVEYNAPKRKAQAVNGVLAVRYPLATRRSQADQRRRPLIHLGSARRPFQVL